MNRFTKIMVGFMALVFMFFGHSQIVEAKDIPDNVVLDDLVDLYSPVEFDHAMHAEESSCSTCHHHTTGEQDNKFCSRCHKNSFPAEDVKRACKDCHEKKRFGAIYLKKLDEHKVFHIDQVGLQGAYHIYCVDCHSENGNASCESCHKRTDAGDKRFRSGKYAPKVTEESANQGH